MLDSRGNPTVAATVQLENDVSATALVPSGASTGQREAVELRDGDPRRYGGKGVTRAVAHVRGVIRTALAGLDITDQRGVDQRLIELDGTPDKARLGANATLGVSMAAARAAATATGEPLYARLAAGRAPSLPVPCLNVINGGRHADNTIDFQEFQIAPHNAPSFAEGLRMGAETFHALKAILKAEGKSTGIGDEGGFAPDLGENQDAVDYILRAIEQAGYRPGHDIALCLDPATSEMRAAADYAFFKSDRASATTAEMIALWSDWVDRYPIVLIEDALAEDDWDGWRELTAALGSRIELVGDDIFCTNPHILQQAIERGVGELDPDQAESNRHGDRDPRMRPAGAGPRLWRLRFPSVGRDRGYVHRRPGGRDRLRPSQDRVRVPGRADSQVQPPARDRARVRRLHPLRGPGRLPPGRRRRTGVIDERLQAAGVK